MSFESRFWLASMSKRQNISSVETLDVEKSIKRAVGALLPIVVQSESGKADAVARREMFITLISSCMRDEEHIMSFHSTYTQRVQQKAQEAQDAGLLEPMAAVKNIPDSMKIDLITKNIDIESDDILAAMKKHDSGSDNNLLIFKFGTPTTLKLPDEARHPDVLRQVFEWQNVNMGRRLLRWKQDGGFGTSQRIVWEKACYSPVFKEGMLESLTHLNGEVGPAGQWGKLIDAQYWAIQRTF